MGKAYSYLRFSTSEQLQGDSLRRQTSLAQEYCLKHGLKLDTEVTYNDLGVSAFRGKNAETGRLADFLEAVRAGLVTKGSYLLVESLDRVSRLSPRKALRVLEAICEEGITVVTLNDGKKYTQEDLDSDPMSLLMSILTFIRANEESVMKSRRLKAAWVGKRLKLKDGVPLTTKGPGWLWWDEEAKTWKLHRDRAEVVRRIYKMASQGIGANSIAETLNKEKTPVFGSGTQWHRSFIVKLLSSSAVVGTYTPHVMEHLDGKKVRKPLEPVPNYFPAAVDAVVFQRVQAMRRDSPSPLRGKATVIHNIFGGLVRCARCGSSMTMQNKGARGVRSLVCSKARYGNGCKYTAIRYLDVESTFLDEAPRILALTPSAEEDRADTLLQLEATIAELDNKRLNLEDLHDRTRDGSVVERLRPIYLELEGLRQTSKDLAKKIDDSAGPLVGKRIADLKKHLKAPQLDRAATNACMRALFSGLSLNPDSGIATLGWKHGGESQFTFGFPKDDGEK